MIAREIKIVSFCSDHYEANKVNQTIAKFREIENNEDTGNCRRKYRNFLWLFNLQEITRILICIVSQLPSYLHSAYNQCLYVSWIIKSNIHKRTLRKILRYVCADALVL